MTLIGLALKGGDPDFDDENGNGGAIYSEARLKILDCTIEQNDAYSGGGIHMNVASGSSTTPREFLTIVGSVIQDNAAEFDDDEDIHDWNDNTVLTVDGVF